MARYEDPATSPRRARVAGLLGFFLDDCTLTSGPAQHFRCESRNPGARLGCLGFSFFQEKTQHRANVYFVSSGVFLEGARVGSGALNAALVCHCLIRNTFEMVRKSL